MCNDNFKQKNQSLSYSNIRLSEENDYSNKKLKNGRWWSDYRVAQEKRQKEINEIVYKNKPEEIGPSLFDTLLIFFAICLVFIMCSIKF